MHTFFLNVLSNSGFQKNVTILLLYVNFIVSFMLQFSHKQGQTAHRSKFIDKGRKGRSSKQKIDKENWTGTISYKRKFAI